MRDGIAVTALVTIGLIIWSAYHYGTVGYKEEQARVNATLQSAAAFDSWAGVSLGSPLNSSGLDRFCQRDLHDLHATTDVMSQPRVECSRAFNNKNPFVPVPPRILRASTAEEAKQVVRCACVAPPAGYQPYGANAGSHEDWALSPMPNAYHSTAIYTVVGGRVSRIDVDVPRTSLVSLMDALSKVHGGAKPYEKGPGSLVWARTLSTAELTIADGKKPARLVLTSGREHDALVRQRQDDLKEQERRDTDKFFKDLKEMKVRIDDQIKNSRSSPPPK